MKSLVVAMDKNNAIGFNGDLPWGRSLKDDLAHFKRVTLGKSIIMGRKTFESIGAKPLPDRENIVISSSPTGISGVLTAGSLDSAYALARYPVAIIGGGQVYTQTLDHADELYVTQVDAAFAKADTFFPSIVDETWREATREHFEVSDRNHYAFDIVHYVRR